MTIDVTYIVESYVYGTKDEDIRKMVMNKFGIILVVTAGLLTVASCQTVSHQEAPSPTIEEVKAKLHLGQPLTDADKKVLADIYNKSN